MTLNPFIVSYVAFCKGITLEIGDKMVADACSSQLAMCPNLIEYESIDISNCNAIREAI